MVGRSLILLLLAAALSVAGSAQGADFTVLTQPGFQFVPDQLTINPGDSVTWENGDGMIHSTTSGLDLDDPDSGLLWSAWLFNLGDTFTYTFNDVGEFPYYCIPHVPLGMTGNVTVVAAPPTGVDERSWGAIKALYQ